MGRIEENHKDPSGNKFVVEYDDNGLASISNLQMWLLTSHLRNISAISFKAVHGPPLQDWREGED